MILVLRIEIVDLVLAGQNGQGTPVTCDSRLMSIYMHEKILIHRKYSRIGNILLSNNPIWSWETLNLLNIFSIFYQADYLATAVLVQVKISNTIWSPYLFQRDVDGVNKLLLASSSIIGWKNFCVMSPTAFKVFISYFYYTEEFILWYVTGMKIWKILGIPLKITQKARYFL